MGISFGLGRLGVVTVLWVWVRTLKVLVEARGKEKMGISICCNCGENDQGLGV